jgi:hypothetical protein
MTDFPPPGGFQPPGGPAPGGPAPPPPPSQPGWAAPAPAPPLGATPYAPAGYQPGWAVLAASAQAHRPLKGLATAITAVLLLSVVAAIVAAMAFLSRAAFVDDTNRVFSEAESKDSAVRAGIGFFFLTYVTVGVLWIIWQFRHAKNAERLRGSLGLGPGWAIGGWFIPFGNFVIPGVQLHQAAKASDPDLPSGAPSGNGRAPVIVIVWLLMFDLSLLVYFAASSSRPSETDLELGVKPISDFARADRGAAFGMFGFAVAAVIAVFMIRTLTDRQERAAATITPAAPAAPVYMPQPQYPQSQYPPQQYPPPQPQTWGAPPPPPPAPPPPGQWGPPPTQ